MATWRSRPDTVAALRKTAEKLYERMTSAPERAQAILYRSPYEAGNRLKETITLRPIWLAATRLLAAHDQQTVPSLLGRVRTRQQMTTLLELCEGGDGGALTPEVKQVLAGADIRAEDAYLAGEQLSALLPTPDAEEERRFRLWLARAEVRLGYHPEAEDIPAEALERLGEAARLDAGQSILNPAAGGGAVAEFLAERVPGASITLAEAHERLRPVLRLLLTLCPSCALTKETEVTHLTGQFDRVIFRLAGRLTTERADVALVRQVYERLVRPGGRLAALLNAGYGEHAPQRQLQAWVEAAGGLFERLQGAGWREALVLDRKSVV